MVVMLKLFGYDAQASHGAMSTLDSAADFRPHVFVIDLVMPGVTGFTLAETTAESQAPRCLANRTDRVPQRVVSGARD